jgi:hypothetical protein
MFAAGTMSTSTPVASNSKKANNHSKLAYVNYTSSSTNSTLAILEVNDLRHCFSIVRGHRNLRVDAAPATAAMRSTDAIGVIVVGPLSTNKHAGILLVVLVDATEKAVDTPSKR